MANIKANRKSLPSWTLGVEWAGQTSDKGRRKQATPDAQAVMVY